MGGQLLAIQNNGVIFVHQDPVTKSQRLTDISGNVVSGIEVDPFGGETNRSWNSGRQPRRYTSYERDGNGNDEAGARTYHGWYKRFDQPDPFDGSYNLADPQSFNRYSYTQNDPVNFTDPTGLVLYALITGTHWYRGNTYLYSTISSISIIDTGAGGGGRRNDGGHGGSGGGGRGGGGGTGGGPQQPVPPPQNLRNGVQDLLNNPECGDFVKNLLAKAGELFSQNGTPFANALDAFDKINSQGGFIFEAKTSDGKPTGGIAPGSIAGGDATVYISPLYMYGVPSAKGTSAAQQSYALTGLHETLHHGSPLGYSDRQLATAAHELMGFQRWSQSPLPSRADLFGNSRYYDAELKRHCETKR